MATIRIGTFNVENLFARYQFNKNVDPQKADIDGWRADQRHFDVYDVNHLKSMMDRQDPCHDRKRTQARREKQAATVKAIDTEGQLRKTAKKVAYLLRLRLPRNEVEIRDPFGL